MFVGSVSVLIIINYVYIFLYHSLQTGNTPLILASREGHKDIVEVLLNHGAEVDLPDKVSVFIKYTYLNFYAVWYYRQFVTIPLDSSC